MNAAWVGIVGVAVGGALTGATAIGTSMFQLRLARLQQQAQEKEAARQRQFDSLRERREPREQAYTAFLEAAHTAVTIMVENYVTARDQNRAVDLRNGAQVQDVGRCAAAVSIAGPSEVRAASELVLAQTVKLFNIYFTPGPTGNDADVKQLISLVNHSLRSFTERAHEALEDHGEEPPTAEEAPRSSRRRWGSRGTAGGPRPS